MNCPPPVLSARQTLLLIMLPLLGVFAGIRLFHHLAGVHHVYPFGFLVRHLFFGTLLVMPAAFVIAFGPRRLITAVLARVAIGAGSAMILDEIVFLIATPAAGADYISRLSLGGAMGFVFLGIVCWESFTNALQETRPIRESSCPA